jgi:hypothetical protein
MISRGRKRSVREEGIATPDSPSRAADIDGSTKEGIGRNVRIVSEGSLVTEGGFRDTVAHPDRKQCPEGILPSGNCDPHACEAEWFVAPPKGGVCFARLA